MLVTKNKMVDFGNSKRRTKKPEFKLEKIGPGQYRKVEVIEDKQPQQIAPKKEKKDATEVVKPDDFTVIKHIGVATARILASRGIITYDDLATASVDFLPEKVQTAISEWRADRG